MGEGARRVGEVCYAGRDLYQYSKDFEGYCNWCYARGYLCQNSKDFKELYVLHTSPTNSMSINNSSGLQPPSPNGRREKISPVEGLTKKRYILLRKIKTYIIMII